VQHGTRLGLGAESARAKRSLYAGDAAPEREEVLMKFRIIVEPDEEGVFVATVPSLPGCVSQGSTRDEALRNVREAIEGYVESLRERNEPIPPSIHEEVIDVAV
jgi:predicted RNase H-like HicB family nuclease